MYAIIRDAGDGEHINIFSYPSSGKPMLFDTYEDACDAADLYCSDSEYEIKDIPNTFDFD